MSESIKFVNEQIRPMAEKLRGLKAEIDAAMLTWHSGIGAGFTGDLTAQVEDGREAEGISRLTANDVVGLVGTIEAVQTLLNEVGRAQVIAKPCVRPLRVD